MAQVTSFLELDIGIKIKRDTPIGRRYLKSKIKQPEFYIYMDSGYLISFEIFDSYKSIYLRTERV